jgi:hypothetical protein
VVLPPSCPRSGVGVGSDVTERSSLYALSENWQEGGNAHIALHCHDGSAADFDGCGSTPVRRTLIAGGTYDNRRLLLDSPELDGPVLGGATGLLRR